ncbi:MAG: hypothetical protein ACOYEB_06920 [Enterococcus lemanii]|jgi:hypothetical protein
MKRQSLLLSLIILVTLFLHFTPLATTYAYFTDSVSIDGSIKLKTGVLSLSSIDTQEIILDSSAEKNISVSLLNTGTLLGKLTIKDISIQMNNQDVSNKYFTVKDIKLINEFIEPGKQSELKFKVKKIFDWDEQTPIILSIKIRLSQANLESDDKGFIDEKNFYLTIKNTNQDIFPENNYFGDKQYYIKENLFYSVVDNKLTTIIPGEVYLKYKEGIQIDKVEQEEMKKHLLEKTTSKDKNNYIFDEISYIDKKGFKMILRLKSNIDRASNLYGWLRLNIDYYRHQGDNSERLPYIGEEEFGLPLLVSSDVNQNNSPQIGFPIIIDQNNSINSFFTFKYQANPGSERKLINLEKYILKNKLSLELVGDKSSDLIFSWHEKYSSFSLKQVTSSSIEGIKINLVNNEGLVLFSRDIQTRQSTRNQVFSTEFEEVPVDIGTVESIRQEELDIIPNEVKEKDTSDKVMPNYSAEQNLFEEDSNSIDPPNLPTDSTTEEP